MASIVRGIEFEAQLHNHLKQILTPHGFYVYSEKEMTDMFGTDITGIDICCILPNKMGFCIQCKQGKTVTVKEMTHFIYCCDVVRDKQLEAGIPMKIAKIWATAYMPSGPAITAAQRKNVYVLAEPNTSTLGHNVTKQIEFLCSDPSFAPKY